ncbi:hypothetical protein FOL47_007114 [Perkinsus chesapeaki]|uniref:Uncharacterized protein n=1 Tax=Perkinsus chesapeaki TaxID=330153 RepID=A0A7J6MWD1_PERCH|nr:hypothetical protein FOL47_007114 [Perkinsus chesapeaki]
MPVARWRRVDMNWFENLFGFKEATHCVTQSRFFEHRLQDGAILLESKVNGRQFHVGRFTIPTLSSLRAEYEAKLEASKANNAFSHSGSLTLSNIVADVRDLHRDSFNWGAVFQVASQFNCLEMPDMSLTPEDGITNYITDPTQGPACAMECAPGTLYRNYFVNVGSDGGLIDTATTDLFELGQRANHQIDCLNHMESKLDNSTNHYWHLRNGYVLPNDPTSLARLSHRLESLPAEALAAVRDSLAVGVQWDTEVSSVESREQRVCQVYCAAAPVAYASGTTTAQWEKFARLVLNGCYESTLLVGALKALEGGKRERVYLTLVGGGVFGNEEEWIVDAIKDSIIRLDLEFGPYIPLDVYIVHHSFTLVLGFTMLLIVFFQLLICVIVTGKRGGKTTTTLAPPVPTTRTTTSTTTPVIVDTKPQTDPDEEEDPVDDLDEEDDPVDDLDEEEDPADDFDEEEDPADDLEEEEDPVDDFDVEAASPSDWFEELFGFRERGASRFDDPYVSVYQNMKLVRPGQYSFGMEMVSRISGERFQVGSFEMPTLKDLRQSTPINYGLRARRQTVQVQNIIADVKDLHRDRSNEGAVFQVASQTNFLEMTSPLGVPEDGITGYMHDHTQGPACAMECAAGTLYRNYFVKVLENKTAAGVMDDDTVKNLGQKGDRQLDALEGLARALRDPQDKGYWLTRNGYAIPTDPSTFKELAGRLRRMSPSEVDNLRASIAVGVQADTQVTTIKDRLQTVTQVYCFALPVAYVHGIAQSDWEPLATLVLDSIYESTLLVAEQVARRHGGAKVYLTLVGGGVFGNKEKWIVDAIEKAVMKVAKVNFRRRHLDIYIVHYHTVPTAFEDLASRLNTKLSL